MWMSILSVCCRRLCRGVFSSGWQSFRREAEKKIETGRRRGRGKATLSLSVVCVLLLSPAEWQPFDPDTVRDNRRAYQDEVATRSMVSRYHEATRSFCPPQFPTATPGVISPALAAALGRCLTHPNAPDMYFAIFALSTPFAHTRAQLR